MTNSIEELLVMPRIDYPDVADPTVARMIQLVRDERHGRLPNIFMMHLHNPAVLRGWLALGTALRYESSVDERSRELTICFVARLLDYDYQWLAHAPIAREVGISEDALDCLPNWVGAKGFDERDRVVLAYVEQVTGSAEIDDETFAAVRNHFSQRQIMELTATAAFYGCAARFLKALEVRADDTVGVPPEHSAPEQ